jgi:hypothetical protein
MTCDFASTLYNKKKLLAEGRQKKRSLDFVNFRKTHKAANQFLMLKI